MARAASFAGLRGNDRRSGARNRLHPLGRGVLALLIAVRWLRCYRFR